jgi:TatD DNase family protein
MLIDTHAHIYWDSYDSDRDEVLKRALDAGVKYIICPGTDLETSVKAIELAEKYDFVYAGVGFHPHDASKADEKSLEKIEELSYHPKVVAIGEIGLDFHYNFSPKEVQIDVFRKQIKIAKRRNLPVIIHNRESHKEIFEVLESEIDDKWTGFGKLADGKLPPPRGVFHTYSGSVRDAWRAINLGFYISISGVVTFKNAGDVVKVVREIQPEHLLVETDSPFLAPQPFRGRRNEPMYVKFVAEKIAQIQGFTLEDIERTTSFNVYRLFRIGEKPEPKIAYKIKNSLYLNLTLRCNADCVFCDRKGEAIVKGYSLKIDREPSAEELIKEIGDPSKYDEVVFVGYGEPTIRLDVIKEVARYVKEHGGRTRLDTDGHGNVINKRNIVPELVGLIDSVSISLNSMDPVEYGRLMNIDGERYYKAMIDFAKECKKYGIDTTMTIVGVDGIDVERHRKFVEEEIGVKFRFRPLF